MLRQGRVDRMGAVAWCCGPACADAAGVSGRQSESVSHSHSTVNKESAGWRTEPQIGWRSAAMHVVCHVQYGGTQPTRHCGKRRLWGPICREFYMSSMLFYNNGMLFYAVL